MTDRSLKPTRPRLEALVAQDCDLLKALVKEALDQILQAEMTESWAPGRASESRPVPDTAPATTSPVW